MSEFKNNIEVMCEHVSVIDKAKGVSLWLLIEKSDKGRKLTTFPIFKLKNLMNFALV